MCDTPKDYSQYQELHQHDGSENYEITIIFPKEYEVYEVLMDTVMKQLNVAGNTNPIDKKETKGGRRKISNMGKVLDEGPICRILRDGTIKYYDTYFNWVFDGDKNEYTFKNPLSANDQKDPEKWLKKFIELYEKASYIYESSWEYHFKIEGEWYKMEYNLDVVNEEFVEQFPPKENEDVRFMELRDLRSGKMEKDTTLLQLVGYEETDSEEGVGFNPISFSAGHYFMELYMPLGDTIKIKRHGSMGTNMQFYKIPVTKGGRNDVVFIVQEPNEMYPNREFGGMYAVRPRSLEQDEHGSHKSNADSFLSQYDSTRGNIDVEAKFLKPMKD
ncbi:MAG TPA: hypothetical protein VFM69_01740 [Pricia sp.]|nr:hypothetical protein [Pricia sp.]